MKEQESTVDDLACKYHFADFTESSYRTILRQAKSKWPFIRYQSYRDVPSGCLWRHDLDCSAHRARRIAQIEVEEGVQATYFVLLHSTFYSPLEKESFIKLKEIRDLGHEIALHFDPSFYDLKLGQTDALERWLKIEKQLLEDLLDVPITVFSFHNPTVGGWNACVEDSLAGMISTYGASLKSRFAYCSDSNGYWGHQRLSDFLDKSEACIQVLTHPVWWTPQEMSPRDRIQRCIEGRARFTEMDYDSLLRDNGRINIKSS